MVAISVSDISASDTVTTVLDVRGLSVGYRRRHAREFTTVVDDVSFSVTPGHTVALVGQSGSGKSTIAQAVAGLLPANGRIVAGDANLLGTSVIGLRGREWRAQRGSTLAYIPQDPLGSLDPLKKVGSLVARSLSLHRGLERREARREAVELLARVGIRDAHRKADSYPHELSGGQLQRVLIAAAIAGNPRVLIADEPTSALDVTVQAVILDLIDDLQAELDLGVLFITHDLAVAHDRSDSIVVLNNGGIAESGPTVEVLSQPQAPYTQRLIADAPGLAHGAPRPADFSKLVAARPVIDISALRKVYRSRDRGSDATTAALDDVNVTVGEGTIHAVVGESGSGKTTLARILAGLEAFDEGAVRVFDRDLPGHPAETNPNARQLQLVYQNPLAVLDPRFTVEQIVREPLDIHGLHDRKERRGVVRELLGQVGLSGDHLSRKPSEISGGQRQRVAIARALALSPQILVLDEPTSALDVTVQARIVELLLNLQATQGLTYVFISHDLGLVRQLATHVTVLDQGRLVESRATEDLFSSPADPYTVKLLESIPGGRLDRHHKVEPSLELAASR
ncbi:dipeptide ABC transporter ATP-binding protein [Gordonia rubripertincta]|uniref:dipeptide ABC transporter ATP-binding protein n=1 Tax=Gordonia rubripertincta TaxID=36822 RepID=UPI000B8DA9AD|nr:ABC transporter ATP-binding protein [Gordonia rubripertincta]ASR04034.1 Glutathione import ATP-binding protein GsiA [Gordonia rubripertincta]